MKNNKRFSYDFWAMVILIFYAILQISRWRAFPQHLDIYYHLLTAWGFIKAGGYVGWDFWQYAPIGRPHIYPPLFHIVLALLMKAGIDKILLAKIFDVTIPLLFLFVLWFFIRKNFSSLLALLLLVTVSSSFSFYASLTNHIPSTIALIFAILAIWQFMNKKILRAALLLTLSFYTHIGTSYFMALSLLIYGLMNKEEIRPACFVLISAFILSLPVMIQQLAGIKLLSLSDIKANYFCEFKTIDYILAAIGFMILLKSKGRGRLFLAFFIASLIYVPYSSRLFSAEGYLPIALLSAVALYGMCESFAENKYIKYATIFLVIFMLTFSPTIATGHVEVGASAYKVYIFDSAIMNMLFPKANERMISKTIWFEKHYAFASKLIKENSSPDEIIYSPDDIIGLCLAVASERASANYLLPEVYAPQALDPFASSRIIVMLKYHPREEVKKLVEKYGLVLLGKDAILDVYKNPSATARIKIRKAIIPFL